MELEPLHKLILDFIEGTDKPIFLTGKAGTGKTTFLRHIRQTTKKNLAVVAPTAVAAINAGGVTIHSFFQMPFGPLIPSGPTEFSAKNFSIDKTKLIKCLDLLIIDEISMVRADTMDYIDRALKFIKGSSRAFGGVQVLMIGDLYQLPPVFQNDWHVLARFYKGPYFFDSQIFQKEQLLTFELTKVHRQSDPIFIEILNQVRNGAISRPQLNELNKHHLGENSHKDLSDYVTLTTHNPLVKEINEHRLNELPGIAHSFKATITGDFPSEGHPTEDELFLKEGAMVMFIKNDSSGEKKYYNGRTATITSINGDKITVSFIDDHSDFEVNKETWENTKFALSESDGKVSQSSAGTFMQFPLRLAWAITIHKSQGLTFDKAVIDAGAAFAHGQTYVALSRCRTLNGLVLKNKIEPSNIITDPSVKKFMEEAQENAPDQDTLQNSMFENDNLKLISYFDFAPTILSYEQLKGVFFELLPNQDSIIEKFSQTSETLIKKIASVAHRFVAKELSLGNVQGEEIRKRIEKAATYFLPLLTQIHQNIIELHQMADGTSYHPDYFPSLNQTIEQLETKVEIFQQFQQRALIKDIESNIKIKAINYKSIDGWKKKTPAIVIENPALYSQLEAWRKQTADQRKLLGYHIISDQALADISAKLPRSLTALAKVKNVGEGKASEYGDEILRMIRNHTGENNLFG